jgi:hypothetical protein
MVAAADPQARGSGLCQSQGAQFIDTQVRILRQKKLVELRRRHGRAGEHGVDLAAVVDVGLKQVRQHVLRPLAIAPVVRPIENDDVVQPVVVQLLAEGDQPGDRPHPARAKRGFGSMRGKARLDESFREPLPEEELKLWEGG